jgi:hypothetical protein
VGALAVGILAVLLLFVFLTVKGSSPVPRFALALDYNGQCGQDRFVVLVSAGKRNGFFLEFGANDARAITPNGVRHS